MAKPDANTVKNAMGTPTALVATYQQTVEAILTKMQNQKVELQLDALRTELKGIVLQWYTTTQTAIMDHASGKANGFRTDPAGIITGDTDYSNAAVIKRWKHAGLVNQYALEHIASLNAQAITDDKIISEPELLKAVANTTDKEVTTTLTNGDTITMNRETGDAIVDMTNADTGVKEKRTFKAFMDTSKSWGARVLEFFSKLGDQAKRIVVETIVRVALFWDKLTKAMQYKIVDGDATKVKTEDAKAPTLVTETVITKDDKDLGTTESIVMS